MALIKCSECGKEVSDRAVTCPGCGNPMAGAHPPVLSVETRDNAVVTTQATAKSFKLLQLLAMLVFTIGIILFAFVDKETGIPSSVAIIGILMYFVGHVLAWWKHG